MREEKKKAEEIIQEFYKWSDGWTDIGYDVVHDIRTQRASAKKCAIIHVKGILNLQNEKECKWLPAIVPDSIKFWQSVLTEIERLK